MKHTLCMGLHVAVVAVAAFAPAEEEGIHIEQASAASFMWVTEDAHGFRWDISGNGMVADGTNDAYDGGLRLKLGGVHFADHPGRMNEQRNELEIGPWEQAGLKISRRIFVNVKAGYCRWIDIFENDSPSPVRAELQYHSNMGEGASRIFTSSGKDKLSEKDWAAVTAGPDANSARPAIVHVFAAESTKLIPRFQYSSGSDELYYHVPLEVPANAAVALCFFEAQRKPFDEAVKFLKEFNPRAELRTLPPALRRILLNMNVQGLQVGPVNIDRSDKADLIVFRSGDKVRGTITNSEYALATEFGEMKFPAQRVIALVNTGSSGDQTFIILTDEQVVGGKLAGGPIKIELADGDNLDAPPADIAHAAYRIDAKKPDQAAPTGPQVELRCGAKLAFEQAELKLVFLASCGKVVLASEHLAAIEMDTPAGGLHRAIFRNGSVLAGLLAEESISLTLTLGPQIQLPRQRIKRLCFHHPATKNDQLTALKLRNADVLYGKFTDAAWTVHTRIGEVKVTPTEIADAEFSFQSLGQVKLVLTSGTTIRGKLAADYVGFKITPGPELKIHLGQIRAAGSASAAAQDQPEDDQPQPTSQATSLTRPSRSLRTSGTLWNDRD